MAKRYKRKTMKKIEPSVQTITLNMDVTPYFPPGRPGLSTYFVDLSQIASLVNRRAYRQGINWAIAGIKVTAAASTSGDVRVKKLPNTWVLANSWRKSLSTWNRMNSETLAETQSVRPRFLDFKIFANKDHHQHGFENNLLPLDADGNPYTPGEWIASKVVIPKTDGTDGVHNREVIAVGSNYPSSGGSGLGAVSMIEGYAASRALPNVLDPNTPNDAASVEGDTPQNWMTAVFNDGTQQADQIMNDMITENNVAPYPFEGGPIVGGGTFTDTQYPGGQNQAPTLELHDLSTISPTTVGAMTRLKGGTFPCGLMVIQTTGLDGIPLIQIDMVPGSHRGYMCESMMEM
ncbi:MAG: hypothetical protein [Circular genetic element sp.]|nr:MAG: hypothetical protein [Circular genetic element sp.]